MRVEKDLPISYASMLKSLAGVNRMKMKQAIATSADSLKVYGNGVEHNRACYI